MSVIRLQFRRGTSTEWTTNNPVLLSGEMGLETDTNRFKIGNGTTHWTGLDYSAGSLNTSKDVDISNLSDGSILVYSASTSKWTSKLDLNQQYIDGGQY